MTIGKRLDRNKRWKLGNIDLTECETYKYLGILFGKSLADSVHVKHHVKTKAIRLNVYLRGILAAHENINRVSFGDSIWEKVIMPALTVQMTAMMAATMEA